MSDSAAPPAGEAPPPPPAPSPRKPPRPTRWLDRLSALLVCAGLAVALAAAAPPILRATGIEVPAPAVLAVPPIPPVAQRPAPGAPRGTGYAYDDHPRFVPDDGQPHVTELERLYPDGMWPTPPPERRELPDPAPAVRPRSGHARSPLTIRERADVLSAVSGRVPEGAPVTVLLEKGEWVLVAHRTEDGATVGWTARSAVVVP